MFHRVGRSAGLISVFVLVHLWALPAGRASAADSPPAGAPANAQAGSERPVTFGGELRLRAEALDNALDLNSAANDSYQYYRMRYRLTADARPREGLRVFLRVGNEYRWGVYDKLVNAGGQVLEPASIRDPESRISLENAWAEVAIGKGLTARFGRMDLAYGEGFLINDGTPLDGSSSGYFDAILLSTGAIGGNTDLFTSKLQETGVGTPASDEDLYGVYHRNGAMDLYALGRNKKGATVAASGIPHPKQWTVAFGQRWAHLPATGWGGAAEGAWQSGRLFRPVPAHHRPPAISYVDDRRAYGGYLHIGYTAPAPWRPAFEAGGVYLSHEWDGFYSEWPKYSDLYLYTLYDGTTKFGPNAGTRYPGDDPGTWTNLRAGWLELRCRPLPFAGTAVRATLLGANEPTGPLGARGGHDRGLLFMGKADLTLAAGVDAQFLGEFLNPGNYYAATADNAWYGRAQVTTKF